MAKYDIKDMDCLFLNTSFVALAALQVNLHDLILLLHVF